MKRKVGRPAANDAFDILAYVVPDDASGIPISNVTPDGLTVVKYAERQAADGEPALTVVRELSGETLARRQRTSLSDTEVWPASD
jgi:hypothetical protein